MEDCRILFLNAARWKKLEGELRRFPPVASAITRPPRNSAKVIDLDKARAAAKPRRND